MPQGGSVNLEMLPILIVALRWGGLAGMATGLVYGLLQLALNPYVVHPLQILLDYPLAYMLVGIAGFFSVRASDEVDRLYLRILPGVLLAGFGRFLAHLLTGVIFSVNMPRKARMSGFIQLYIMAAIYCHQY